MAVEPLSDADPRRVGEYEVLGLLGAGGMGRVLLGRGPEGEQVAVKVVHEALAGNREFRRRFEQEAQSARRVQGRHVAGLIAWDHDAPRPWMATEYVPGPSLQQQVESQGPLAPLQVLELAAGIAGALADIHAVGVIHRDLKPSNILLAPDGVKVIDFGIARATDATHLTDTGVIAGSAPFMSPEQAMGDVVSAAGDVFSMGSVLHYAATGTSLFGTGAAPAVMFRVVHHAAELSGVEDERVAQLISRCVAKDPAERPSPQQVRALAAAPVRSARAADTLRTSGAERAAAAREALGWATPPASPGAAGGAGSGSLAGAVPDTRILGAGTGGITFDDLVPPPGLGATAPGTATAASGSVPDTVRSPGGASLRTSPDAGAILQRPEVRQGPEVTQRPGVVEAVMPMPPGPGRTREGRRRSSVFVAAVVLGIVAAGAGGWVALRPRAASVGQALTVTPSSGPASPTADATIPVSPPTASSSAGVVSPTDTTSTPSGATTGATGAAGTAGATSAAGATGATGATGTAGPTVRPSGAGATAGSPTPRGSTPSTARPTTTAVVSGAPGPRPDPASCLAAPREAGVSLRGDHRPVRGPAARTTRGCHDVHVKLTAATVTTHARACVEKGAGGVRCGGWVVLHYPNTWDTLLRGLPDGSRWYAELYAPEAETITYFYAS